MQCPHSIVVLLPIEEYSTVQQSSRQSMVKQVDDASKGSSAMTISFDQMDENSDRHDVAS